MILFKKKQIKKLLLIIYFYKTFNVVCILLEVWYDYQLEWDPAEYGGITVIRIQPDRVWKPDIVLFNKSVAFQGL